VATVPCQRGAGVATAAIAVLALVAACSGRDDAAGGSGSRADSTRAARPSVDEIVDLQRVYYRDGLPGRWAGVRRDTEDETPADELTPEQREEIRRLESLGYVSGSRSAPEWRNVVRHDRDRAWAGVNLYTSGHGPEAVLMDMDGRVLHRWARAYREVWPDTVLERSERSEEHWRRAWLYPNGDLLAIFEGLALIKLDRDSRVLWANHCRAHHDLEVQPDGDILVLAREAKVLRRVHPSTPLLEDFVLRLGPDGREKSRVSLLECFENSREYRTIWDDRRERSGDVFHTNSLEVLDGRLAARVPEFAAGRLLLSVLALDAVAVVDLARREVVWALQGGFEHQHDATLLPDGNLMLLDNYHAPGRSAVLVFDPATKELLSAYTGSDADPFYTRTCGTNQPLPNGSLLVTESDNGRAFELAPDGTKVWEFYNPHRAGERDEFIATLFEVRRFGPDFPIDWADGVR